MNADHRHGSPAVEAADDDDLPSEVVESCRAIEMLQCAGWQLRALDYDPVRDIGTVVAQTPTRRVVTVCWDQRNRKCFRQQVSDLLPALVLLKIAHDLVALGHQEQDHGEELLDLLRLMAQVTAHRPTRRGARAWVRSDPLPILSAAGQPGVRCRAAAWLLARLIGKYRWRISELGSEIAGGGFIADIPGEEAMAVFPAGLSFDGTAASVLAGLLGQLSLRELAVLARLDYRTLWCVDHPASAAG